MNMKLSLFYRGSLCMNDTVQSEIPCDISHFREVRNKREIQEPNLNETRILVHFLYFGLGHCDMHPNNLTSSQHICLDLLHMMLQKRSSSPLQWL